MPNALPSSSPETQAPPAMIPTGHTRFENAKIPFNGAVNIMDFSTYNTVEGGGALFIEDPRPTRFMLTLKQDLELFTHASDSKAEWVDALALHAGSDPHPDKSSRH